MFQLDKHEAGITNINFRKENHGDEKATAADIKIELQASSMLLDSIDPELRKRFFKKPGKGEQQALPIDGNNLTALAMPYLSEQKIGHEFEGYEVELAGLLDHIEPLFLADVKVKKLAFLPVEGGSIELSLTIASLLTEEDDAPLVAAWRRGGVRLSLTPPSMSAAAMNDPDGAQDEAA